MPGTIKISLLEAAALIGLGIIIESPEKRRAVISTLDKVAASIGKTVADFIPRGGAANVPTSSSGSASLDADKRSAVSEISDLQ